MIAYAIAHLRHVSVGPEIVEYLERINSTLEPSAAGSSSMAASSTSWRATGPEISL